MKKLLLCLTVLSAACNSEDRELRKEFVRLTEEVSRLQQYCLTKDSLTRVQFNKIMLIQQQDVQLHKIQVETDRLLVKRIDNFLK